MQDSSAFQFLAIDQIHESTTNPRRTFDEAKLRELAESIKHNGLIQPITVRPNSQRGLLQFRRIRADTAKFRRKQVRFDGSRTVCVAQSALLAVSNRQSLSPNLRHIPEVGDKSRFVSTRLINECIGDMARIQDRC